MTRDRQILDAAARLFYERGFHGVGVDEIGASIGITGPAIYRHFEGKDEILAALFLEAMDQLMVGSDIPRQEPRADLEMLIRTQVEFALANRELVSVFSREERSLIDPWRRRFRRRMREHAERWEGALARCCPQADERTIAAAAQAAIGLVHSVAFWPAVALRAPDLVELLCRLVTDGLASLADVRQHGHGHGSGAAAGVSAA